MNETSVVQLSAAAPKKTVPLVIVSPVRNEDRYLRMTFESMLAQSVQPMEWLLVDDGSTDGTRSIIDEHVAKHPWIRVVSRADRGFRKLGSGVIAAFNEGKAQLQAQDWRYIAKMDGDMSFDPSYIEIMLAKMEAETDIAAISGKVFRPEDGGLVEEYMIDEMVAGQFHLYRRTAFEAIGGLTQTLMWEGIGLQRSRMQGYRTVSFYHPDAKLYHHRLMGSSDRNIFVGRMRLGGGIWFMGYHPVYAVASGLFRMHEKPYVIGGIIIIFAYFKSWIQGKPQFDDADFREKLRQWQMQKLRKMVLGRFIRN